MGYSAPERVRPDELDEVWRLCQAVFRPEEPESDTLVREHPVTLGPDNLEHMWTVRADGKPVAFLAVVTGTVRSEGCRLRRASLGAVCTHPAHRGQGLASRLLEHVIAAYGQDCDLLLVSGTRSLYARAGCVRVGRAERYRVRPALLAEWEPSGSHLRVRPMEPGDVVPMYRCLLEEPVRFEKTLARFALQLMGRPAALGRGRALVLEEGGRVRGWWAVERRGSQARVLDGAGPRALWNRALPALVRALEVEELAWVLGPQDEPLRGELVRRGVVPEIRALAGTFRALNVRGLADGVGPALAARGYAVATAGPAGVRLVDGAGRSWALGAADWLHFLLGRPPAPAHAPPAVDLPPELGLPLPDPEGLDFV